MNEPTAEDAAVLITSVMGAGTVRRLDVVHQALLAAYRAGREAERLEHVDLVNEAAERFAAEARRLAAGHAEDFVNAVQDCARRHTERDSLPWHQRQAIPA